MSEIHSENATTKRESEIVEIMSDSRLSDPSPRARSLAACRASRAGRRPRWEPRMLPEALALSRQGDAKILPSHAAFQKRQQLGQSIKAAIILT